MPGAMPAEVRDLTTVLSLYLLAVPAFPTQAIPVFFAQLADIQAAHYLWNGSSENDPPD